MKAVDHAVERLCAREAPPLADAAALQALKLLYTSLPQLGGANDNLKLRMDCQFGMWLSMFGGTSGVPVGASHAIGHVIGGYGVPHGHTTGVCLPSVLRWNYDANAARQAHAGAVIGVAGDKLADAILGLRDKARRADLPARRRHQARPARRHRRKIPARSADEDQSEAGDDRGAGNGDA